VPPAPLTIIVGAGISGLSCAFALHKLGKKVLLLEAAGRPGGVIQSSQEEGYLLELGPQSFSATSEISEICDELQLDAELLEAPHGLPRYILIDGKLKSVPLSPPALLFSDLLSWGTKISFLRDLIGNSIPPEPDESIGDFVRRKFSGELLERLVGPFVSGIYAGDPEQLSLRAAFPKLYAAEKASGSLIRGGLKTGVQTAQKPVTQPRSRPRLLSFRGGNERLIRALATAIGPALRCNVEVNDVSRSAKGFELRVRTAGGVEMLECDSLVIATPTGSSVRLLGNIAPNAIDALQQISYAPVAVVSLGYKREQVQHSLAGFGFLAPRSSKLQTLGSVWNSSLFPGRAPQGSVLLTNFVGGTTNPGAVEEPPNELLSLIHRELASLLGIKGEPAFTKVTAWSRAIPQYNLGHLGRLKKIQEAVSAVPNLWMIGNYWNGPAVGSCVEQAFDVARQV
jgi:oxygen-dependent protoporphyrinogen oxidase